MPFTATHVASTLTPKFEWRARVNPFPLVCLRVLDSLFDGIGSGRVTLFGLTVASASGVPEMHSGALHRYLAEAVWYPTALQPSEALTWSPIDEHRALATLTDRGTSVSLEFRFAPRGEVAGVFTPARWGRFAGGYERRAWEGHFEDYAAVEGVRIPMQGSVGWYVGEKLELVWSGDISKAEFS